MLVLVMAFVFLGSISNYALFAFISDVGYDKWVAGTIADLGITRITICVLVVIPGALALAFIAYAALLNAISVVKKMVRFVRN